ncbi:MAG: hypothetical protein LW628_00245 [Fimbriimonadaceae bacterium]|nr:hypothetical protein [Fimbriimonadaceae bacterium]
MALDTTRLKAIIGITCVLGAFAVSFGSGDAKQSEESNLGPKAAGKKSAAGSERTLWQKSLRITVRQMNRLRLLPRLR